MSREGRREERKMRPEHTITQCEENILKNENNFPLGCSSKTFFFKAESSAF